MIRTWTIKCSPGGTKGPLWDAIRSVRERVFLQEQQIPPEEEWDSLDSEPRVLHLAAVNADGSALGVARVYFDPLAPTADGGTAPAWRIGRMAVLPESRGLGIGLALLQRGLDEGARRWSDFAAPQPASSIPRAILSAQCHAIPFYEKAGFVAFGEEFNDAGIPHRWMERPLTP
jgi:predicted GNAT family N-acyltransferase